MKDFIGKVISKMHKLDSDQIHKLFVDVVTQNKRFSMVLDSITDGVLVSDNDHTLVFCNKPATRMLSIRTENTGKQQIWKCISDSEVSAFVQDTLLSDSQVIERDFSFTTVGGRLIILCCSMYPLVHRGSIQGSLLFIKNVTEKRQQEAQFRRTENLAALTTLAAGVAHEIKNPLASISIHVQLMQKSLRKKDSINIKFLERYIDIVNEEVDRLNSIVVDFLFSVRPMDISLKLMNITHVIGDILDFVKYELKSKKVALKRELATTLPQIAIDFRYIKQVILNLLKNSMIAMPRGGEIIIKTVLSGNNVQVSVSDSGRGMSKTTIDKIFEPYFSTNEGGSGLGMTFVYRIMKEHGGDVSVSSQVNKGTIVTLSFPIPQSERRLIE